MAASSQKLVEGEFSYASHAGNANAAVRVLLLDDQGHVLRVMRSIIESQGFEVVTALNEDAALLLLLNSACDALIISGDVASQGAQHICECANDRLGEQSPLILLLESVSSEWTEQYSFVRSLSMPFSRKAIVDCLSASFPPSPDLL